MKNEKNQNNEKESHEDELDFYDIMLEAIKLGLLPRSS